MSATVRLHVDGRMVEVPAGASVAAAVAQATLQFRQSSSGQARPLCGMGCVSNAACASMAWDSNARAWWTHAMACRYAPMAERVLHFDVLVIGAGPAGLAAARAAVSQGVRVGVVDMQPRTGGQVWRSDVHSGAPADARALLQQVAGNASITVLTRTQILLAQPGWLLADGPTGTLQLRTPRWCWPPVRANCCCHSRMDPARRHRCRRGAGAGQAGLAAGWQARAGGRQWPVVAGQCSHVATAWRARARHSRTDLAGRLAPVRTAAVALAGQGRAGGGAAPAAACSGISRRQHGDCRARRHAVARSGTRRAQRPHASCLRSTGGGLWLGAQYRACAIAGLPAASVRRTSRCRWMRCCVPASPRSLPPAKSAASAGATAH